MNHRILQSLFLIGALTADHLANAHQVQRPQQERDALRKSRHKSNNHTSQRYLNSRSKKGSKTAAPTDSADLFYSAPRPPPTYPPPAPRPAEAALASSATNSPVPVLATDPPVSPPVQTPTEYPTFAPVRAPNPAPVTIAAEIPSEELQPVSSPPDDPPPLQSSFSSKTKGSEDDEEEDESENEEPSPASPPTTSAPTPTHASCLAARAGEVYLTPNLQEVPFQYELLLEAGTPVSMVTSMLDAKFQDFLAMALVNCSLAEESNVQGVDTAYQSIITEASCQRIQRMGNGNFCLVIQSAVTLYLSEDPSEDATALQDHVYRTMQLVVNGPGNRRGRSLFESPFLDPDRGIHDMYFITRPSNEGVDSISRSNNQNGNGTSVGGAVTATLFAVAFVAFGVFGLLWFRRKHHHREDDDTLFQKATVASRERSFDGESAGSTYNSPQSKRKRDHFLGDGIEVEPMATPSELSCPQDISGIDRIPPTSLFEAYEATPDEDGDHVFYQSVSKQGYHLGRSRTQQVARIPLEMIENSILEPSEDWIDQPSSRTMDSPHRNQHTTPFLRTSSTRSCDRLSRSSPPSKSSRMPLPPNHDDELLDEPPSYLSKIPRSATCPIHRKNNPTCSRSPVPTPTMTERKIGSLGTHRGKAKDPPSSSRRPRYADQFTCPPQYGQDPLPSKEASPVKDETPPNDSFSVTGFLNGHCAAMEGFYNKGDILCSNDDTVLDVSRKESPTSVSGFWKDPAASTSKIPTRESRRKHTSSVNLWTSFCNTALADELEESDYNDNEADPWIQTAMKYIAGFSPYGSDEREPNLADIVKNPCTSTPCTEDSSVGESPDFRGRSPTPVVHSTNGGSSRSRSSGRTPRNPPARRLTTQLDLEALSCKHSRTPSVSSMSSISHIPRRRSSSRNNVSHLAPSAYRQTRRGDQRHFSSLRTSDTIQF